MSLTVLELIQAACYEANIPAPSTIASPTSSDHLQLFNLFHSVGRELRQARYWPQLKKKFTVFLDSNIASYQLPQDFYCACPMTHWDRENQWEMSGPMTDREWGYRLYGYVTLQNRKAYRIFGPDSNVVTSQVNGGGQLQINPVPGDAQQGIAVTFEYISKSWLSPPSWAASTAYTTANYVNSSGNIYKCSTNGTSGSLPPRMIGYRQGLDGGVVWYQVDVSSWSGASYYAPGDHVTNGGNLYLCTSGGVPSAGPSGTGNSITDGTVTWKYISVGTWAAETAVEFDDYILQNTYYYKCITPGIQGNNTQKTSKNAPNWHQGLVTDNTAVWTFYQPAYERLLTDTDLCLFDDDLMIAGLKWRFLQARGLEYQDLKAEYELKKDTAVSRWDAGRKLSLVDEGFSLAGLNPDVSEGDFGL